MAAVHPDREKMLIEVVAGPYETWPLPWYLRRFGRVGYWTRAAEAPPPGKPPSSSPTPNRPAASNPS